MAGHFNYVSYGAEGYLEEDSFDLSMSRGRMFEYTPVDMEKRLESLSVDSLAFMEQLPTFVCSEIGKARKSAVMRIRFGVIEHVVADRKEVSATFRPIIEFGEVIFPDVEAATALFEAGGFQLYRTHWAVKEGDVGRILRGLAELNPAAMEAVEQYLGASDEPEATTEPPLRDKNVIGTAGSIESLVGLLYDQSEPGKENFFRGHENQAFELVPSLLRKWRGGAWKYLPVEDRLCNELLIAHSDEFRADQFCFDRLVRMQHYGLPTRLLDISGNPLIALYFACAGAPAEIDNPGEVIIFRIRQETIKYFDSDTVSCISNLSKMTTDQKGQIDLTLDLVNFNEQHSVRKLLHHVQSEKSYFERRIVPSDLGSVVCVKAKRANDRIKSQSGAFLLFGHEAKLPETGTDGIEIRRITITNKRHILSQLDSININATTVYPSIDQTAVHLKARHEVSEATA